MTLQETGSNLPNLKELPDKNIDRLAHQLAVQQIQLLLTSRGGTSLKYAPFPLTDLLKLHPQVLPIKFGRIHATGIVQRVKREYGTDEFLITVNEHVAEVVPEVTFTIAHELAHILTNTTSVVSSYPQTEKLCEEFAAQLLLPRTLILLWLDQIGWQITPEDIENASAYLQVPMYFFVKRLDQEKDLMNKIRKCILLGAVTWDSDGRKLAPRVLYSATPDWITFPERTELGQVNQLILKPFFAQHFTTQTGTTDVWAVLKRKSLIEVSINTQLVTKPVLSSFRPGELGGNSDFRNSRCILVLFDVPPRRQGVRRF